MRESKPRVMIILDTIRLGGPGKGILQFLRSSQDLTFGLYCFRYSSKRNNEFVSEARRLNIDIHFFEQKFSFDPSPILAASRDITAKKFNVIQTHGYKADVIGFIIKMVKRLHWIAFAHGFTAENFKVKSYNLLDKVLLRKADVIIAVSESVKDILVGKNKGTKKIRVIHNAVDPADYVDGNSTENIRRKCGLASDLPLIGVIGRLSREKGQMYFLKAVKMCLKHHIGFQAVLIGEGHDRTLLNEYIKKNDLGGNVKLAGYQKDIVSWYKTLDLLVLPSLSEGLPNVVLEAMLFNVPVIATDVGGVSNIINGENGILISPKRPDILSARMIELISDPDRRQRIINKAKADLYPKFSPSKRAKDIESVYNEVLRK